MIFLLFIKLACASAIVIQLPASPSTLNPYHVTDVVGFNVVANTNEGLVKSDANGNLSLGLAKSYRIESKGTLYVFELKKNIFWSDASVIEPYDFVRGIQIALDPKTAARDAGLLGSIQLGPDHRPLVWAKGNKIYFKLKQADSSFLAALTMPLAGPRKSIDWSWQSPSSGAYKVSLFDPEKEIRLVPHPKRTEAKEEIIFRLVPEETTALSLFETGGLDILVTVPATEQERLAKQLYRFTSAATFFLTGSFEKSFFGTLSNRRNLRAAVDRDRLRKLPHSSIIPTTNYLPRALFQRQVRPVKSQGKNSKPFTLTYASSAFSSLVAQRLQADLSRALKTTISLEPLEWKAFLAKLTHDTPELYLSGYSAPFMDSMSHLKVFVSKEPDNRIGFKNIAYDMAVRQVQATQGSSRDQAIQKAHEILVDQEVAVIPLFEKEQVFAASGKLEGFRVNPFGVMDLPSLRIKP